MPYTYQQLTDHVREDGLLTFLAVDSDTGVEAVCTSDTEAEAVASFDTTFTPPAPVNVEERIASLAAKLVEKGALTQADVDAVTATDVKGP